MMAYTEVEEPELQRLLPPWTFSDEAAYNEACARNHRWLRDRMRLVLDGPAAPVMRSQKPEDEHKPIHKVPRKNASGGGRPRAKILFSLDEVRALVEKGRTTSQIAELAGCHPSVIMKMRIILKVVRPCPDCLRPTGRNQQATYCLDCAKKRDRHNRMAEDGTRKTRGPRLCGLEGCGNPHFGKGLCDKHYKQQRKAQAIQEAV